MMVGKNANHNIKAMEKQVLKALIPEQYAPPPLLFFLHHPKTAEGIKLKLSDFNPILPGLLNTLQTWGGAYFTLPPNSLVFYPRSIKFGM